jgi:hypothetical protein
MLLLLLLLLLLSFAPIEQQTPSATLTIASSPTLGRSSRAV